MTQGPSNKPEGRQEGKIESGLSDVPQDFDAPPSPVNENVDQARRNISGAISTDPIDVVINYYTPYGNRVEARL